MKILFIVLNSTQEAEICKILDSAKEINYSFDELIRVISAPMQILHSKIHAVFGVKYVNKEEILTDKLAEDILKQSKWNLKFQKIIKWIFKIWTKKTKSERVSFYVVSKVFFSGLEDIYRGIDNIAISFDSLSIVFENEDQFKNFDTERFSFKFNSLIINKEESLKEQVLSFVNRTVF